jgi:hypothetical protein
MHQKRVTFGRGQEFWWGASRTHQKGTFLAGSPDSGMIYPHKVSLASRICHENFDVVCPWIPPSATLLAQPPAQPPSPATPPWLRSAPWSQLPPPVSVGLRQRSMKAQGVSLGVACCHCCKVAQDATRPISSRAAGSTASAVLMALPLVGPAAGAPRVSPREALPGRAEAGGRGPTREQASRLLRCGRRHAPLGDTPGGRG